MKKKQTINRLDRGVYLLLSMAFAISVLVQFFLAGLGVFVSPTHWSQHVMFVHLFGMTIPFSLLIFAWIGALPRWRIGKYLACWSLFS